ncbi:ABC transporter substrate-binding protein [Allokutzneria albata]|uniref:Iron complex transport system substrate-binding protein n=1 Tax=Allokutzneria albata TaxID=211114 RepID=A0A1G9RJ65_ALLAB|nr:ABC transporter substrate-binding protein [Allokutzneria albata]SDM23201.1 iron complex transport system substrate-binding protein [Allokutzneria albata]
MSTTRRAFLGGMGLLALGACGSPRGAAGGTAWEFTDDRGRKAGRPSRPQRVVAQITAAAALWDLGIRPVGVFGPQKRPDGSNEVMIGNVDLSTTQSVGITYGEFNVDKFLSLRPDLVVTVMYGDELWYIPKEPTPTIESVAPIIGIRLNGRSARTNIESFVKLAADLGADTKAPAVTEAKTDFDRAAEGLSAAAKSGLKVLVVSANKDKLYIATPTYHGDLKLFQELGVDVVVPNAGKDAFESLSWEQADRYPADVILVDSRAATSIPRAELNAIPTWSRHPAVRAGQVFEWAAETPYSYNRFAPVLRSLTDALGKSRRV